MSHTPEGMWAVSEETYDTDVSWINEPKAKFHKTKIEKTSLRKGSEKNYHPMKKERNKENAKVIAGKKRFFEQKVLKKKCRNIIQSFIVELNR